MRISCQHYASQHQAAGRKMDRTNPKRQKQSYSCESNKFTFSNLKPKKQAATNPTTREPYAGSRSMLKTEGSPFCVFFGGRRVRAKNVAIMSRIILIEALIRTPLWNPILPLKNLFSMIGWTTAPVLCCKSRDQK
jgi:hypothetical protein